MTEIKTDPRAHDQLEAGLASEHGPNIIQMADYPPGYDRFMVLEPGTNNQNNMYTDGFSQRQNHTNHTESPASGDMGKDDHPQANDGTTSVTPLEQTTDEEAYLTGFALASILLGITLAYFLVFLDMAVISTATPAITTTFDSLVDVGWYGGAYQLGTAALQPLSGKIYTHFSTKWSLISFFVVFEIGSAICGAAHSSAMFIAGRTIAGMGASGLGAGCMTIISCILPPSKQPAVMGVNIGLAQVGLAIGPIIGGAFTSNSSATWRWCFYLNLPLGAIIGPAILFHTIPENKPKLPALEVLRNRETIKSLDLMGFALISPAAIMLFLGLQFGGNSHPWNSSTVIGLLVGAFVTFGVFLAWEYRQGDEAMVPFAMLRHKIIWSAAATAALNVSSILIADFYVAIYFQVVHNDSPIMSAVHMLPMTLGVVLFTMTSGGLTSALGYYLPWMVAGTSLSAIGYGLLSELSPTTPVARWIGNQVLYGIGGGCTAVGPVIAIQSLVPKEQVPIAMSILIFSQNLGGAVFLIVANAIFNNVLRQQLQERISTIGISPDTIINAGARSVRALVPSGPALAAVVQSYSNSIDRVMYLGVALAVGGFVFCWGLGFKNVKKLGKLEAITDKPKEQSAESVQPKSH